MTQQPPHVFAWGKTDIGKKRERNEDSFLVATDINLFIVADGMGGHAGGATASHLATEAIEEVVRSNQNILTQNQAYQGPLIENPVAKLLSDALRGACHVVFQKGSEVASLSGMGTTATTLVIHRHHAFVGHVGDSRAYLIRDGEIVQLSEDHSLVNEQLKAGIISQEEALHSRFRNIITRSIGFENDVDVDMAALPILPNDAFLLCTDGLSNLITDIEVLHIVTEHTLAEASQMLIDLANQRGGDDNITAILVYITEPSKATRKAAAAKTLRIAAKR